MMTGRSDQWYQPPDELEHDADDCDLFPCSECNRADYEDYVTDLKVKELKEEGVQ